MLRAHVSVLQGNEVRRSRMPVRQELWGALKGNFCRKTVWQHRIMQQIGLEGTFTGHLVELLLQ